MKKSWIIKSLVSNHKDEADTLEEAQIIAKWNFLKGYEIIDRWTDRLHERWEHFCHACRKCSTCNHLFSEHHPEKNKCLEKKCKCKEFTFEATDKADSKAPATVEIDIRPGSSGDKGTS